MTTSVYLRFYEELNDFLSPTHRKERFEYTFEGVLTIQDLLRRLGVPTSQVELVLADGASVDFAYTLQQGEWISFYPIFESFDIRPVLRVRAQPLRETRFTTGAGLRPLARYLRLCGFDTIDGSDLLPDEIARLSETEGRILLVHGNQLLPARSLSHVRHLQNLKPRKQLLEIMDALDLVASARLLSRCPSCNRPLPAAKETAIFPGALPLSIPPRCQGCVNRISGGPRLRRVNWFLRHVLGAGATPP